MAPLSIVEKKLIDNSTYYQSYQKTNGWQKTAKLIRDKMHQNSKGDRRNN